MKKLFILLIAVAFAGFTSCSGDDDDGAAQEATIVGTWTLVSMSPPAFDMSCPNKPTITFNADGTTTWTLYDSENNCESSTSSGTWVNTSGSNYTVTVPDFGNVTGTINFSGQDQFTFNTVVNGIPVVLNFEK